MIKGIWRFIVDVFGIISCIFTVLSCCFAYNAVKEIINLKIEISPVVEKFQRDSVFVEKILPDKAADIDENVLTRGEEFQIESEKDKFKKRMKEALKEYKDKKHANAL